MALVKRRSRQLVNPFEYTLDGDVYNMLFEEDTVNINIEDVILGCIRSYKANEPETNYRDFVNTGNVIKIYANVSKLNSKSVRNYLRCSERQAQKYIEVIKLCNPFITKQLFNPKTNIVGYISNRHTPIYEVSRAELGGD